MSKQSCIQRFKELKDLLKQIQEKQFTKMEELVVLVHSVNTSLGLECLNQNNQICEYPLHWNQPKEGVYRFKYNIKKGKNKDKVVQFRLVDIVDGLSVNIVVQNSQNLLNTELSWQNNIEQNIAKIKQQVLKISQQEEVKSYQENRNNSVIRPIIDLDFNNQTRPTQTRRQPEPLLGFQPGGLPLVNPFGREQYIGPNSNLFSRSNGLRVPPTGNRPPPGARWDPIDPFDGTGNNNPNEFFGFDEWGQPRIPKGGNCFGPQNQFRPGNGGFFG